MPGRLRSELCAWGVKISTISLAELPLRNSQNFDIYSIVIGLLNSVRAILYIWNHISRSIWSRIGTI